MRPTVDALAKHHRVITFSLCDERSSPFPCDPAKAFENYVEQVEHRARSRRGRSGGDRRRVVRRADRQRICRATCRSASPGWCWPRRCTRRGIRTRNKSATCGRPGSCRRCSWRRRRRGCGRRWSRRSRGLVERLQVYDHVRPQRDAGAGIAGEDGAPHSMGAATSICRRLRRPGSRADHYRRA